MKKVTVFLGTPRKQATYKAVLEFEKYLTNDAEIEFEYVFLKNYRLDYCLGCKLCFNKGEEHCPLKDDRDLLLEKMQASDGVIFATPLYAFQVSAPMKNLLDRLAFVFHRPQFFGKTFTAIVSQGILGGGKIVKYLDDMGGYYGFQVAKGCVLNALEPTTAAVEARNSRKLKNAAARFHKELMRTAIPVPSLFRLLLFRMARTSIKSMLNPQYRDYRHYEEKGWFESGYYYPVSLGPYKKLLGRLFDVLGTRMVKRP
ncbi:NADPH-dependent FMN reductase [Paenibacillus helianthi]|uniref:NADPH-dependent FMN reductase n=1 Tax=Paenibacillus helianthi TaxID=1349432 RepID=A0ABX3EXU0_9BACL|nr:MULTISPECIES: flavodoxin family protein [Paenibacillus]OKP77094.1 NADPH-dependent FMN reductase [Paenibacillus sp. P3E]OKP91573.1 NADPH-dependent FMN reductase [Paenibacillus helianthi]